MIPSSDIVYKRRRIEDVYLTPCEIDSTQNTCNEESQDSIAHSKWLHEFQSRELLKNNETDSIHKASLLNLQNQVKLNTVERD